MRQRNINVNFLLAGCDFVSRQGFIVPPGQKIADVIPLLNKARSLGPFDLSYQVSYKDILNRKNNVRAKSYDRLNKYGKPFPNGEWIDDLYWITCNFYKLKNKTKFKKPK